LCEPPRPLVGNLAERTRSALVIGVSWLDRYMHERIVKKIVPALKRGSLCKEPSEFTISAAAAYPIRITKIRFHGSIELMSAGQIRIDQKRSPESDIREFNVAPKGCSRTSRETISICRAKPMRAQRLDPPQGTASTILLRGSLHPVAATPEPSSSSVESKSQNPSFEADGPSRLSPSRSRLAVGTFASRKSIVRPESRRPSC
jgi:hypothetical protein